MTAPLPTLRRDANGNLKPLGRDEHLDHLAAEALRFVREGRSDVAITALVHAVLVAYGTTAGAPQSLRTTLNEIIVAGGGFE